MNFDFSEDQKALKDQVRKFLDQSCPLAVTRRVLDGEDTHAADVWKGLAELGAMGIAIPETYGGMGLGALDLCVVAEEMGRACAPVPYSSTVYLVAEAILRFGSDAQKSAWLPRIADGSAIGTLAAAEGPQAPNERNIRASFSGGKLSGAKVPVSDGEAANVAVVLASSGGGLSLVLADLGQCGGQGGGQAGGQAGIARERVAQIDPTRKHARLTFQGAAAEPLGPAGQGWRLLTELYDAAAVYFAFEQIGGAESALWMARDYALERQAFGRQIGSYQGIKHKLADVYIKMELARSNAYYAAMMLAEKGADLPIAAAAARVAAIEAYEFAAKENIQTHGGIGFTWEANPQFHYRRARVLALNIGGALAWKHRLVSLLEKKNAA